LPAAVVPTGTLSTRMRGSVSASRYSRDPSVDPTSVKTMSSSEWVCARIDSVRLRRCGIPLKTGTTTEATGLTGVSIRL
jgi:hypothetical protein